MYKLIYKRVIFNYEIKCQNILTFRKLLTKWSLKNSNYEMLQLRNVTHRIIHVTILSLQCMKVPFHIWTLITTLFHSNTRQNFLIKDSF